MTPLTLNEPVLWNSSALSARPGTRSLPSRSGRPPHAAADRLRGAKDVVVGERLGDHRGSLRRQSPGLATPAAVTRAVGDVPSRQNGARGARSRRRRPPPATMGRPPAAGARAPGAGPPARTRRPRRRRRRARLVRLARPGAHAARPPGRRRLRRRLRRPGRPVRPPRDGSVSRRRPRPRGRAPRASDRDPRSRRPRPAPARRRLPSAARGPASLLARALVGPRPARRRGSLGRCPRDRASPRPAPPLPRRVRAGGRARLGVPPRRGPAVPGVRRSRGRLSDRPHDCGRLRASAGSGSSPGSCSRDPPSSWPRRTPSSG